MTKLLTQGPCLAFQSNMAQSFGLNESIVLQQLHYWITSSKKDEVDGHIWIYNTYSQWKKQFSFWSEITIRRALKSLEERKIIICKSKFYNFAKTKYYTINYDILANLGFKLNSKETPDQKCHDQKDQPIRSKRSDDLIKLISPIYRTKNTNKESLSKKQEAEINQKVTFVDHKKIERDNLIISKNNISENIPPEIIQNSILKDTSCEELQASAQNIDENIEIPQQKIEEEMLDIWNNIFQNEGREKVKSSESRMKNTYFIAELFEHDLSKWKKYCHKIISSKFLMGDITSFRASFDWATREENINKIQEGNYRFGDRTISSKNKETDANDIDLDIKYKDPLWSEVIELFKKKYGIATTKSWIVKLEFKQTGQGMVSLSSNSSFIISYIKDKYQEELKAMFNKASNGLIDNLALETIP